ncbi:MAG: hypothetical protein K5Q00_01655 [Gammaproteobacteria bacterium]|nr:hypothetical protein [Gammaproteobacteria bacterium]
MPRVFDRTYSLLSSQTDFGRATICALEAIHLAPYSISFNYFHDHSESYPKIMCRISCYKDCTLQEKRELTFDLKQTACFVKIHIHLRRVLETHIDPKLLQSLKSIEISNATYNTDRVSLVLCMISDRTTLAAKQIVADVIFFHDGTCQLTQPPRITTIPSNETNRQRTELERSKENLALYNCAPSIVKNFWDKILDNLEIQPEKITQDLEKIKEDMMQMDPTEEIRILCLPNKPFPPYINSQMEKIRWAILAERAILVTKKLSC